MRKTNTKNNIIDRIERLEGVMLVRESYALYRLGNGDILQIPLSETMRNTFTPPKGASFFNYELGGAYGVELLLAEVRRQAEEATETQDWEECPVLTIEPRK